MIDTSAECRLLEGTYWRTFKTGLGMDYPFPTTEELKEKYAEVFENESVTALSNWRDNKR